MLWIAYAVVCFVVVMTVVYLAEEDLMSREWFNRIIEIIIILVGVFLELEFLLPKR
jgi:hypothetical protein